MVWPTLIRLVGRYVALAAILVSATSVGPALARDLVTHAAVAPAVAIHGAVAPAVRFIHVDGAKIAYRDFNPQAKGTPLMMIVGYDATMAEWDPTLVQGLAQGRRLIMFDNR